MRYFIWRFALVTFLLFGMWAAPPLAALAQDSPSDTTAVEDGRSQESTPVPPEAPLQVGAAFGVQVTPASAEKSNAPDSVVSYTLKVKNTGSSKDSFGIGISSANGWNTWASPGSVDNLAAGATAKVTVSVAIPDGAALGDNDEAIITFTSAGDPSEQASARLTTRAVVPTATPQTSKRPLVVVEWYTYDNNLIDTDQEFDIDVRLVNKGQSTAVNLVASFESGEFYPRDTGGVRSVSSLGSGDKVTLTQPMLAASSLSSSTGVVKLNVTYDDNTGASYSEMFNLTLNTTGTGGGSGSWATSTPTTQPRPQLVVSANRVDVDPLQPGTVFNLELEIRNMGSDSARAVTMVLGGGANVDISSGTPQPGSGSGGSSDLTNFAPLGSSNLVYLGDIQQAATMTVGSKLIVNVTTQPGAYPLKLSFVYNDSKGNRVIDDQVITLLVFSLPQVEVNFYRDPGVFFAGQPSPLPLQVTNLGRKTTVLGNLKVTAADAEVTNNVSLVGALDSGGYFTHDATLIPSKPGPLELTVTINYTDDFNQPRTISEVLIIDVQEALSMMPGGPGMEGMPPGGAPFGPGGEGGGGWPVEMPVSEETFGQKALRALKGLVGLDSAPPSPEPQMYEMEMPIEKMPAP